MPFIRSTDDIMLTSNSSTADEWQRRILFLVGFILGEFTYLRALHERDSNNGSSDEDYFDLDRWRHQSLYQGVQRRGLL